MIFRVMQIIINMKVIRRRTEMEKLPLMLSIASASNETGLSQNVLRKLCESGQVTTIKIGKKFYINTVSLQEILTTGTVVETKKDEHSVGSSVKGDIR